jgi:hypothetical protein
MGGQLLVCLAMMSATGAEDAAPLSGRAVERSVYQTAQKEAGHDASAQVRLALWCEAHGLAADRMKHLALAVLYDPSNVLARGLVGLVAYQGKWSRPDEVSGHAQDDPKRRQLTREYLERRARTADRADDQWKLAIWCEENGLKDQAIAHYHAVLRRDPGREGALRRLGFKKLGGRWIKPEWQAAQKQESEQQNKANKHWKPLLEKWSLALAGRDKARRAEAGKALSEVTDPRAVPAIWAVFAPKDTEGQKLGVRLLGQIDAPGSSRALALLALLSPSSDVRRSATQTLRRRDPRDFAQLLIGMLRDPIKYEVRPVSGPGSTGELLVKNPDVNVRRLYSPPPPPNVPIEVGDSLSFDAAGLPVINRFSQYVSGQVRVPGNSLAAGEAMFGLNQPGHGNQPGNPHGNLGLYFPLGGSGVTQPGPRPQVVDLGGPQLAGSTLFASEVVNRQSIIPIGQMILEAQQAAQSAQQQLAGDARAIDAYNANLQEANRNIRQVLEGAIGVDVGADRVAWTKWVVDLFGYAYTSPTDSRYEPPTVVEQVPLAYQPQAAPGIVSDQVTAVVFQRQHSCFGAGTTVQTLDGPRRIEDLRGGDLVLTQHPKSGELKYEVLVAVFHNPPNETFRVELDGDSIVATGIHRLWKAGKGWTMTRDLKPGDALRTLGGTAVVKSVEAGRVQPVYNLQVAEGESFFVGRSGVLAHDNSTINPTPEPFDAVPALGRSR